MELEMDYKTTADSLYNLYPIELNKLVMPYAKDEDGQEYLDLDHSEVVSWMEELLKNRKIFPCVGGWEVFCSEGKWFVSAEINGIRSANHINSSCESFGQALASLILLAKSKTIVLRWMEGE